MTKLLVASLFAFLPLFLAPNDAQACACCSDPGERREATAKMTAYEKLEIERVRFAKRTAVFENAGGSGPGVDATTGPLELSVTRAKDQWTVTVKDARGKVGTLVFALPETLEAFATDLRDGKPGAEPVLYKEWRFQGRVAASSGLFASARKTGEDAPTVRVVLQGRGNSCTSAEQFGHYVIVVTGPSARFSLFGELGAPSAARP